MSRWVLLLASSLIAIELASSTTVGAPPAQTQLEKVTPTTVKIVNNLAGGNQVTVHCRSKDDDLRPHVLAENQSVDWSFNLNFFETTLFYCDFNTIDSSARFDIYVGSRDTERCPVDCKWAVKNDGVYGFRENENKADLFFPWPNLSLS